MLSSKIFMMLLVALISFQLIVVMAFVDNGKNFVEKRDASEATVVEVTTIYRFDCRSVIPEGPNSLVGSIYATFLYNRDILCANFSLTLLDLFNIDINGNISQIELSITNSSIIQQQGIRHFTSYGSIISGPCAGGAWGRLLPIQSEEIDNCAASNSKLNLITSLKSYFVVISDGCGFNLCDGTFTAAFNPPLQ